MAPNFSNHSSPESNRPQVEAIISQATDLCVLEHIAALNTAHISDDASLPTHLENRFRKLKSFPEANPQRRTTTTTPNFTSPSQEEEIIPKSLKVSQSLPIPSSLGDPKPEHVAADEDQITSAKQETAAVPVPDSKLKKKSENGSSPTRSIDSSRRSPSPPRQTCCFWCYSKKDMKKKTKGIEGWWENDEILSSLKEQQRKLKKALKEQEKVNQEADKMVKWIKQASARMNSAAIDELLSDDEEFK
ncbi:hypothetical protein J5N97_024888 [Dioscorea zingiberensis]|uniref:Uncharacterized protein n=1 Tax=Dioscorea zingiberensis TaxID=325984 RepID=A0A9D5C7I0_9LILI|nr:hypothetical protein J5N97_024888 [Dioscorea zingiberensis]